MEFHLLPVHRGDPAIEVPKTPYLARERYDGGPFLSYLFRKGKATKALDGTPFDSLEYRRAEWINPTPIKEQVSFFQTWLYFGLIAEFAGVNAADEASFDSTSSKSTKDIEHIYKLLLKQNNQYVKLDTDTLEELLALGRTRLPKDPGARKQHYLHIKTCLAYTHAIILTVPRSFDHRVRCSICALGELFTTTLNYAFTLMKVPTFFPGSWGTGFLDEEAKSIMVRMTWINLPINVFKSESPS